MEGSVMTSVIGRDGKVLGYIVRGDSGSHFVQSKRVPAGHAVNLGPTYPTMLKGTV